MKVIDLLNRIANKEEVPKKIEYEDDIYSCVNDDCYYCEDTNAILSYRIFANHEKLNEEVKIIEEIENPKEIDEEHNFYSYAEYEKNKHEVDKVLYIIRAINKIEEKYSNIAKVVNYLLKKEEK